MRVTCFAALTVACSLAACDQSGLTSINPTAMLPPGSADASLMATAPDMALPPAPVPDLGDNGAPSSSYPAFFPAPPQVIKGHGPVMSTPRVVPVYFANDDAKVTAQATDFLNRVGATNYWKAVTSEYGVGPLVATMPVQLTESAVGTISDQMIQTWLMNKLNGNDPMFPAADQNTVYALHYPANVTITLQGGKNPQKSCSSFGGYHSNIRLDSNHQRIYVAYAVMPRCMGGMTLIDALTATESHELMEVVTDPFPQSFSAYYTVDNDHYYWSMIIGGGEVGDMCENRRTSYTKFNELPYEVQRGWSNAEALAGHDPCVPAPAGAVFFGAVPVLPDTDNLFGQMQPILDVDIPIGMPRTIDLDLFSDADTGGPFTVTVHDTRAQNGQQANLIFSLDRSQGQNGEKLHLTITPQQATNSGFDYFTVTSTLGNRSYSWYGAVSEVTM